MKTILVARKPDEFSRILTANGFAIINLPLIETAPLEDLSEFDRRLKNIAVYDGVFLTSRRAAEVFRNRLREKRINYRGAVYVLGKRSREILNGENLDLFFDAAARTAREMLENIAPEKLADKKFLFVRGAESLRVVPEFLSKTAAVDETTVYETRKLRIGTDEKKIVRARIESGETVAACFFSPSAAANFLEQFGTDVLHLIVIATIGETTAEFFRARNVRVGFVSAETAAASFAASLIEHLRKTKIVL